MPTRTHVPFDLFAMQTEVATSSLVRAGEFGWTCGQCPLDHEGKVLAPGDTMAQAAFVCDMIDAVLPRAGFGGQSIGKLNVYYVEDRNDTAEALAALFRKRFGDGPLIVPVELPHFYYDGMMIEVDVFAGPAPASRPVDPTPGIELAAVESGDLVWVSVSARPEAEHGLENALEKIVSALEANGFGPDHLLSDHWFLAGEGHARKALKGCPFVTMPGAAIRRAGRKHTELTGELTFSRRRVTLINASDASTGVSTVSRAAGPLLWSVATVPDPKRDLVAQTRPAMLELQAVLVASGMSFADVTKLTTHYTGSASSDDLHGNMEVRHCFYGNPGPASTGVPVSGLLDDRCRLSIDIYADRIDLVD